MSFHVHIVCRKKMIMLFLLFISVPEIDRIENDVTHKPLNTSGNSYSLAHETQGMFCSTLNLRDLTKLHTDFK